MSPIHAIARIERLHQLFDRCRLMLFVPRQKQTLRAHQGILWNAMISKGIDGSHVSGKLDFNNSPLYGAQHNLVSIDARLTHDQLRIGSPRQRWHVFGVIQRSVAFSFFRGIHFTQKIIVGLAKRSGGIPVGSGHMRPSTSSVRPSLGLCTDAF
jgi:hypothetical protein